LIAELESQGGTWIPFPAHTKNPFRILSHAGHLVRLCQREGVHLIHARSRAPAWSAFLAARILNIPFVTTYHGIYSGSFWVKRLYNSIMARGDVVIANSQYTADIIEKLYPFARSALCTIPRGTDFRHFDPNSVDLLRMNRLREIWGVDACRRLILVPARITPWKGHRIVIEAARLLQKRGLMDNICIICAGDSQGRRHYVDELQGSVRAYGLESSVRFVGHCCDMPAAFKLSDAVVVASIEPEAFGRVAVEAQAMGKPLVVSNLGAVSETVYVSPSGSAEESTGWRVEPGNASALAACLAEILTLSEDQRHALALRTRAYVEKLFSVEQMLENTWKVYSALLNSNTDLKTASV
jgi:glycosyltransferase involved in cell wall biosynthesis